MKLMAERLEENSPYNIFFSTIPGFLETLDQRNSITFKDLLCPSLGELKCSLQLNFLVNFEWLLEQYTEMGQGEKPLTVLYGLERNTEMIEDIQLQFPNLTQEFVAVENKYGIHHSKIGIYVYNDNSLRVVISTANLYYADWNCYCQRLQVIKRDGTIPLGLWISPLCPPLSSDRQDTAGAGPTYFKPTLLSYLKCYNKPILEPWINYVKRADFSAIKVCLVTSTPGIHKSIDWPAHCHLHRVGELLSLHCTFPPETSYEVREPLSWDILLQSSSLGFMGNNWLRGTLLRSLASHKKCRLPENSNAVVRIIYPSEDDVENGHFGEEGAGCLHYEKDFHKNQEWLNNHLCHWKADHTNRTKAIPHTKSYCRISPCMTKLAWFLLTSANLSRSAWGSDIKNGGSNVRSYEAGVLFLPKYFGKLYFQIKKNCENDDVEDIFPFIYDIPVTPYDSNDKPFFVSLP